MKFSQCLYYALDQWSDHGGGIIMTTSTHWCIPHVQHIAKDKTITQFVPAGDLREPWHSIFGFWGAVELGDKNWLNRKPPKIVCLLAGVVILSVLGGWWAVGRAVAAIFRTMP